MCLMVDKDYSESFSVTVNSDNTEGGIEKLTKKFYVHISDKVVKVVLLSFLCVQTSPYNLTW